MSVTARPWGATREGTPVTLFRLEAPDGAYVQVLDYGAILQAAAVPDRTGRLRDVCLGFDTPAEYQEKHDGYLGALVGRCANRIRGARFQLDGRPWPLAANQPPNHLHGGVRGFDQYLWDHRVQDDALVLTRRSPAGEEGYPGALQTEAQYTFTPDHVLRLTLRAVSDADTVVNLTSHAYWNLNGHGGGDVGEHTLSIDAIAYTELAADNCPTGTLASVVGTPFDLRIPRALSAGWDAGHPQIRQGGGYDHNWALRGRGLREAAVLHAPESGITLTLSTTQPGLQVYTANFLPEMTGKGRAAYGRRRGVALEAQGFPNAANQPEFPSTVLRAGEPYHQEIAFAFTHD